MTRRPGKAREPVTRVVVGHANPDFDAYAAMVAATKLYPGSKAVFLGSQNANVREFHNLHEEFLEFVDLKQLDVSAVRQVIMVDTRDPDRIGEMGRVVRTPGVEVIVYDHHPHSEGDLVAPADHSMNVGASTSILVHQIRDRAVALTPLEASVMLLGIHEDTGSLTYPSTTPYDADAVAFLMAAGADIEVLNRFMSRTLTVVQRELLDVLLETLELWDIHGHQIAVGTAVATEYVDSASVLTHYICEDLGYRVAVAIIAMPDRLHVVGRSRLPEVDIGAVLKHLGGGGHPQAASTALKGAHIPDIVARLREALELEVSAPLKARDIMTSPVRVVTPEMTMAEAGRLMATWGHGGLPVSEDGRLVGLVTRKDVDKAVRHGLDHAPLTGFMARDPITIGPDVDLASLEGLLGRSGIGRVPVVEGDQILGIVTRKDLLRAEHGAAYMDRGVAQQRSAASHRFMASFEQLVPTDVRDAVRALGALADEQGLRAHVVGGFVRDMLLGRPNLDVDIVIEGDGLAFAEHAAKVLGYRIRVHHRFGTAVLVASKTLHLDITSARTEYYTRPGALPTVERSSLRQDLFRRDFSINAMAACISPGCFGVIVDPFGGLADLEHGIVRCLHSLSFVEDPTRVLRAVRFERRYGFAIDGSTEALLRQAVVLGMLEEVSGARIREEMLDILDEELAAEVLRRLEEFGALETLVPEGIDRARVLDEVGRVAAGLPEISGRFPHPVRRQAALTTPLAASASRASAERWARRLRLGREYSAAALLIVERREVVVRLLKDGRKMLDSRLYFLLQPLPDVAIVYLWAVGERLARERIERYLDVLAGVRIAVSGDDLTALGMKPGPGYSAILAQALADRLDGRAVGRAAELSNLRRLARPRRAT
ncbi:MAG: tRNA nucleotidyltransferase [Actinobacteria bacterium]|nr:MAG: tRNA nucleotidyltransferase [Actinomycetota bacterium]MDO8949606.1 CBS domain-containing protein [Actinomycetota bacterium]